MKSKLVTLVLVLAMMTSLLGGVSFAQTTDNSNDVYQFVGEGNLSIKLIGRYDSGSGEGGAEIICYAKEAQKAFVVNGADQALDIIDLSTLVSDGSVSNLSKSLRIDLIDFETVDSAGSITSVAISPDESIVAVAIPAEDKTEAGKVVLLDIDGNHLNTITVGALPDMVTFSNDGSYLLVANEGEPNEDYTVDPEGSVSIIDVTAGAKKVTITTAVFDEEVVIAGDVRKANNEASYAETFEPEYIVMSSDDNYAYVVLQESNAIATIDMATKTFVKVQSLGVKDFSIEANKMDASNKDDAVNITNYPILSLYQPDGIDIINVDGKDYILTPNEGDSQDYEGYSEEVRVGDIADSIVLNGDNYAGYTQDELDQLVADGLFEDEKLGRLKITIANGQNADGMYEALYGYGGRSFSIFDPEDMSLVYDSGTDFANITYEALPGYFNADEGKMDGRSDDKGMEPEDIEVGTVGNKQYAFIALERFNGMMVYDVTNPSTPVFDQYLTTASYSGEVAAGDLAPEGQYFVAAEDSITGNPLLLQACEVSGTVAVFEITENTGTQITVLHVNDTHGRVIEGDYDGMGLAKFATVIETEKAKNENILVLDAGDTFHGTTFATLEEGASVVEVMNQLGYDAMVPGNHDFNYGYERLLELAEMANFPIICSNVVNDEGELILEPYTILDIEGVKVAIIGVTTPETTYKTHPDNVVGLTFLDPVTAVQDTVNEIEDQADLIIVLAHLGTDASSVDKSTDLAENVTGIDLIVDGHSHTTYENGYISNGTIIVSTGEYDKNVGIVNMTLDKDKTITNISARLFTKDQSASIEGNAAVTATVEKISAGQEEILAEVVGVTSVDLLGEREVVRTGETNLGNLITDAMIAESGAQIAITNGGGIRASISAGNVTKGDIITVLPFGNYIVTKALTGAEIKEALEHGTDSYPEAKGAFPHVSGMSYTIDTSREVGDRIVNMNIDGVEMDMNTTYIVAMNDFLAAGGDDYTMISESVILNEYASLDEALIEYMAEIGTVAPEIQGRITITTGVENVDVGIEDAGSDGSEGDTDEDTGNFYIVQLGDVLWRIAEKYQTSWEEISKLNDLKNPHLIFPEQKLLLP
jgi:2',3'-cyclic-nucleotide 2'-phosphodiesterase (5'-nucleotidase family)